MTISDSSGVTSARSSSSSNRSAATRSGSAWSRFGAEPAADEGGGSGGGSGTGTGDPGQGQPGKNGDPFSGTDETGDQRDCAVVIKWDVFHTAEDERVCPECAPLDGQWYQQGQGPIPPLHDSCRCTRTYIWWDCYQSDGSWEKGGRPE